MQFGYTIVYVLDVAASSHLAGFTRRFLHRVRHLRRAGNRQHYAGLAAHALGEMNSAAMWRPTTSPQPLGMELGFVTPDVATAHSTALQRVPPSCRPRKPNPGPGGVVCALPGRFAGGAVRWVDSFDGMCPPAHIPPAHAATNTVASPRAAQSPSNSQNSSPASPPQSPPDTAGPTWRGHWPHTAFR